MTNLTVAHKFTHNLCNVLYLMLPFISEYSNLMQQPWVNITQLKLILQILCSLLTKQ